MARISSKPSILSSLVISGESTASLLRQVTRWADQPHRAGLKAAPHRIDDPQRDYKERREYGGADEASFRITRPRWRGRVIRATNAPPFAEVRIARWPFPECRSATAPSSSTSCAA